ncbi:glycosyltransferase [Psychrobacter faecalis]|uniref:glycosyltransferase n=1 Tax=Psychrobacter faecalis TaxID=180588 RepID=UPI003FD2D969
MKVVHVITGGHGRGGAEGALLRLVGYTSDSIEHIVYTLQDMPDYKPDFLNAGINLQSLNIKNPRKFLLNLIKFKKDMQSVQPNLIQTWMRHPNFMFGLIGKSLGIPVVWNIRQGTLDKKTLGFRNNVILKANATLSHSVPVQIVNCSLRSIKLHKKVGYADKFVYIPNGNIIETELSQKNTQASLISGFIVGHVGRYSIAKNHKLFINAFSQFHSTYKESKALMVGPGVTLSNKSFTDNFESVLNPPFELLGQLDSRAELSEVYKKMDCLVLSSITEGFPNVLIEAMSFGVPCISTDVGDAAEIISDTGWIVPSEDQNALESTLEEAYREFVDFPEKWADRRERAYKRAVKNYSIEKMCERYIEVWNEVINHTTNKRSQ